MGRKNLEIEAMLHALKNFSYHMKQGDTEVISYKDTQYVYNGVCCIAVIDHYKRNIDLFPRRLAVHEDNVSNVRRIVTRMNAILEMFNKDVKVVVHKGQFKLVGAPATWSIKLLS